MSSSHSASSRAGKPVLSAPILSVLAFLALGLTLMFGAQHAGAAPAAPQPTCEDQATSTTYQPATQPETCVVKVISNGGDDNIIEVGEPVHFRLGHFQPGTIAHLTVHVDTNGDGILEDFIIEAVVDEFGNADFDWTVAAGVESGDYGFDIEGIDETTGLPRTASGAIHIEALGAFVPGDGTTGPLPYTGSNSTNLVRIAAVLLLAGGISVIAVRRRSAHSNA